MSSALTRLMQLPRLAQASARRGIASKPALSPMGTKETLIGLSTFLGCCLLPSGYILSNMESYKKRD